MEAMQGNAKLMKPLFYDGYFNSGGKKMRAVLEREVTNGQDIYRLWRSAGKPDLEYPRAENDAYVLHVEIGEYLAPLKMTDFYMVDHCGFEAAVEYLYGGIDGRSKYFDSLRSSGQNGDDAVLDALKQEEEKIKQFGNEPARQADYIKSILDKHVSTYLASKSDGGESFPDFVGALVLGELPTCVDLSATYRQRHEAKDRERRAKAEAEEKAYCEERNRVAEQKVEAAVRIIKEGGVLQNDTVEFYRARHDSSAYSIINHLTRKYGVDVPLRTQGWINEKLHSVTIKNGRCEQLQYMRHMRSKGAKCSQKFFECMDNLISAVTGGEKTQNEEEK